MDFLFNECPKLIETYNKLGTCQDKKRLSGVAVDAVFDSVSWKDFKGVTNVYLNNFLSYKIAFNSKEKDEF